MAHNPAFIVEGHMEQRILQKICGGHPIRKLNCNGDHVEIERVCDFLETQIRTLGNRNYPIVVIFDRERRELDSNSIHDRVIEILNERGFAELDIRVFVADREFEDWYLKDLASICAHFGIPVPTGNFSGKGGLSRALGSVLDYHETTVGVEIFSIVSLVSISNSCDIFRRLMETARELKCAELTYRLEGL